MNGWSATPHSLNCWILKHMVTAIILFQTLLLSWSQPASLAFNNFLAKASISETANHHPLAIDKGIKTDPNDKAGYQVKTIVIDAGHGGHDPGCLGGHSREKHLALGIALKLRDLMQERHPDIRIIMTRDDDTFIPLYKRAAIANRNQADLFISIHCNFMPGSSATRGSETYVMGLHTAEHNLQVAKRENASILLEDDYEKNYDYDPNSPEGHIMLSMFQNAYLEQSILFAERVENQLKTQAQRRSRGVKQAGFVVLKETTMPSVLIEAGFLSNATEEKFLMSDHGQQSVATAILAAFTEYRNTLEDQPGAPLAQLVNLESPQEVVPREKEMAQQPAKAIAAAMPPLQDPPKQNHETSEQPPKVYSNVYRPQVPPKPDDRDPSSEHQAIRAQGPVPQAQSISLTSRSPEPTQSHQQHPPETIQFFVQLAASQYPQPTTEPRWRDLPYSIQVVKEGELFKYRARHFKNLEEAVEAKQYLRTHGFPEAFVIAYSGEERISIEKAKALQNLK